MQTGNAWVRGALCAVLLLGASVFLQAQAPPQFKADMQMSGRGMNTQGKFNFNGSKMRMEMAMRGQNQVMIIDPAKKVVYMVMPEQKMYMEMNADAPGPMKPPKVEAMDPANPCSGQGITDCKKLGTETVNGYASEKWEYTQAGQKYTAWIATKLRMPIKSVGADGTTFEFRNIVEGAQPANLFEVPAGYEKMDMGGMMGMMGGMGGGMSGMGGTGGGGGMGGGGDMSQMQAMADKMSAAADAMDTGDTEKPSEPASIWGQGKGWLLNVTVTAKGSSEGRNEEFRSQWHDTYSAKYVASIPLNFVTSGALGMIGPTWSLVPTPEAVAPEIKDKPITFTGEKEFQRTFSSKERCPIDAARDGKTTSKGTVSAKAPITDVSALLLASHALVQLSEDETTYGINVGAGTNGTEQSITQTTESGCGDPPSKQEETSSKESKFDFSFELNDLPLPSSRSPLKGSKTVPMRFMIGDFDGQLDATVEWNITPF